VCPVLPRVKRCNPVEYTYFPAVFLVISRTLLVLMLTYYRYKSTLANLIAPQMSHCVIRKFHCFSLHFHVVEKCSK
jgi:hypothetical protein